MLKYCVTLRSGGPYSKENVIALHAQTQKYLKVPHEFVCYTDIPINNKYIKEIKLENDWPSFWATLEMWNNQGPTILTGLDTVIFDNIDRIGELALSCKEDQIYMCRPRNKRMIDLGFWATGITVWNGDWSWIVKDIDINKIMEKWKWEQMYVSSKIIGRGLKATIIQDLIPGWYSYKVLRKLAHPNKPKKPKNITIMTFAGNPRPHDCTEEWIKEAYELYKTWSFKIPMEEIRDEDRADSEENNGIPQDMLDNKPKGHVNDIRDDEEYGAAVDKNERRVDNEGIVTS